MCGSGPLMLSLKDVFEMFDKDGSGMIDHREFAAALKHMGEVRSRDIFLFYVSFAIVSMLDRRR